MDASIIVPSFNSEKTIKECIKALKNQDYNGKYEIIVVDDGSTDRTTDIVEKEKVILFKQKNSGPAKARNNGAKIAKGKVLLFIDSDCIADKNWLKEMLEPFKDKEVVGVQGAYKTKQESLVAKFVQYEIEERYEKMLNSKKIDWIGSYSAAYKKNIFFAVKGFDESFPQASGEDPELSFKVSKTKGKLVFNPKAIVYHSHPETISKYFWVKFYRAFYRINLYSKHPDKIINDSYTLNSIKVQVLAAYFGTLMWFLVPLFYFLEMQSMAEIMFAINFVLLIIATLTVFKSCWLMAKKDIKMSVFAFLMIQVRTLAFMLGLPAGFFNKMIKIRA
ncbi:MAG: glycosyltransferase [Candidatus Diapherotrites archaeon]